MTEYTKINFFKKLAMSIKDLDKYDQLAIQPIRKTVGYFIKLLLLFSIILAIVYSIQIFQLGNAAKEKINEVPNFKYEKGELKFEDNTPIILNDVTNILNGVLILPDENAETAKESIAKIKTYDSYLILNKSNFIVSMNDKRLQYNYDELLQNYSIKKFDKQELETFIETLDMRTLAIAFFIVLIPYLLCIYIITIGLDICLTFIISFCTTRLARIRLKTSALINVSIYSLTLSIILYLIYSIINVVTGFEITNFRIMYVAVAAIYSVISILIIKADFIEKQQELAKVIKEQQAIRAEFEKEEENNSENNNENRINDSIGNAENNQKNDDTNQPQEDKQED